MNVELSEACWVLIVARNQQGTGGKLRERPRYEQRVLQRGRGTWPLSLNSRRQLVLHHNTKLQSENKKTPKQKKTQSSQQPLSDPCLMLSFWVSAYCS